MDKHFHLLLKVPAKAGADAAMLPEREILRRLRCIYSAAEVAEIQRIFGHAARVAAAYIDLNPVRAGRGRPWRSTG